jgi:hypothetical protein
VIVERARIVDAAMPEFSNSNMRARRFATTVRVSGLSL